MDTWVDVFACRLYRGGNIHPHHQNYGSLIFTIGIASTVSVGDRIERHAIPKTITFFVFGISNLNGERES